MNFNNKSLVIIILGIMGCGAIYTGNNDLALAIGSGLVGFLSATKMNGGDDDDQGA